MARLNRYELLDPEAIDTVHVYNRVVRRCLLFGDDPVTGKNYDHRKGWIEDLIARRIGRVASTPHLVCANYSIAS